MADIGQATTATVSAYERGRIHVSRLYAAEKRQLVANFAGVMPAGTTIASATWQTLAPVSLVMSGPTIAGKTAYITIAAQLWGPTVIRCTVTLSNGERYVQQFRVNVLGQPVYSGETYVAGPTELTVTA